jgi:predicted GNAT family acetyltransferase
MTDEQPAIELVDHPLGGHYDAVVDGATAGSAFYRVVEGRLVVTHTEVRDEFEGQGVGGAIAKGLLATVRANGQQIVPLCPFISGYIERHPEYEDLVDRATYDRLVAG